MKKLLVLELLALFAMALVFLLLTGDKAVDIPNNEDAAMIDLVGTPLRLTEGTVVSKGSDFVSLSTDEGVVELRCVTPNAKYLLEKLSVGDFAKIGHFDKNNPDGLPLCEVYSIEKRYTLSELQGQQKRAL